VCAQLWKGQARRRLCSIFPGNLLPTAPSSGGTKPGAEGSHIFPGAAGCCAQLGEFQARCSTLFTGLTFVDF
ncbi:hypothetical protein A2U01_0100288, partial [Trifolium medium]|nr:hypothetical protein [Trifolium medium]